LDRAERLAGKVLDRSKQRGDRRALELGPPHGEAALGGAAVLGRIEEAPALQRAAEQLEAAAVGKMESDVDVAVGLEVIEERLAEGQAKLDAAEMLAALRDRHHAANPESGDPAFEADHDPTLLVGDKYGLAEARKVVAEFGGLVHAQIRRRGRHVELE